MMSSDMTLFSLETLADVTASMLPDVSLLR